MRIQYSDEFTKSAKHLSKSFPHFRDDFNRFVKGLITGVIHTGDHLYTDDERGIQHWKARVMSSDTSSGKSRGFRVIYGRRSDSEGGLIELYMLFVYHKTKKEDLTPEEYKAIKRFDFCFTDTLLG